MALLSRRTQLGQHLGGPSPTLASTREAQAPHQNLPIHNAGHRIGPSKILLETPNAAANHSQFLGDLNVQD